LIVAKKYVKLAIVKQLKKKGGQNDYT